jgi:hypothetical protein
VDYPDLFEFRNSTTAEELARIRFIAIRIVVVNLRGSINRLTLSFCALQEF